MSKKLRSRVSPEEFKAEEFLAEQPLAGEIVPGSAVIEEPVFIPQVSPTPMVKVRRAGPFSHHQWLHPYSQTLITNSEFVAVPNDRWTKQHLAAGSLITE